MSAPVRPGPPLCRRHPQARAGWRCAGCEALLCPRCTTVRQLRALTFEACAACGDRALRLTVPRAQASPLWRRILQDALGFPFGRAGLVPFLVLAAVQAIAAGLGLPWPLALTIAAFGGVSFWGYAFYVIRATGDGRLIDGGSGGLSVGEDLLRPALKGLVATTFIWLPALVYAVWVRGFASSDFGTWRPLADPVVWLLGLAGIAYGPMAILAAATEVKLLEMSHPLRIFAYIRAVGPDYGIAVGALAGAWLLWDVVDVGLAPALAGLGIPFLAAFVAQAAGLYAPVVMVRILGLLLHVHGHALDWGLPEAYVDPVLPGAQPAAPPLSPNRPGTGTTGPT